MLILWPFSDTSLKRLQTSGPPKLLDPQKVVPFSERDKYDKSYIPNVCLAPEEGKKLEDDDDDDDDEVEEATVTDVSGLSSSKSSND